MRELLETLSKEDEERYKPIAIDVFIKDVGFYSVTKKENGIFSEIFTPWDCVARFALDPGRHVIGINYVEDSRSGIYFNTEEEAKSTLKKLLEGYRAHYKRKYNIDD